MEHRREQVLKLYSDGNSYQQIAKLLNMSKSTVAYYVRESENLENIDKQDLKRERQKEYEDLVCWLATQHNNINQICKMLNKKATNTNYELIKNILLKHNVDISHFNDTPFKSTKNVLTKENIFCEDSKLKNNNKLKDKILKYSLKKRICEKCKNTHWNGELIPLEVHHINGNRHDNRLENLQFLCPNCHAQTDNFCGKNINKKKIEKPKTELRKNTKCPDKETLINDFKIKGSFKQVGQIYGVTDNAVKKWFKKYELPTSSPEMRKFIIEQFGKQPQWYEYRNQRDYTKSIEKNGVKIDVYDSTGLFLNEFSSISQASKFTGVGKSSIARVLKGKNIKDKRFIFKYHSGFESL